MTLQEFILAAILTAVPQNAQKFGALQDKPRITAFSHTIAQAIEADSKNVKFTGDARHYVLATIVVATIWRESSFRKSVQFCKRKGDGGKSITSFQMMKPWALSRRVKHTKRFRQYNGEFKEYSYYTWKKIYTEQQICNDTDLATAQFLYLWSYIQQQSDRSVPANWFAIYGTGKSRRIITTDRWCRQWQVLARKMNLKGANCVRRQDIKFKNYNDLTKQVKKTLREW